VCVYARIRVCARQELIEAREPALREMVEGKTELENALRELGVTVNENMTLKQRVEQLMTSTEESRREMAEGRRQLDNVLSELHVQKGENASLTELVRELGSTARQNRDELNATGEALRAALAKYVDCSSTHEGPHRWPIRAETLRDAPLDVLVQRLDECHAAERVRAGERISELDKALTEVQRKLDLKSGDLNEQIARIEAHWQGLLVKKIAELTRERDAAVTTVAITQRDAYALRESLEATATTLDTALRSVGSLTHEKKSMGELVPHPQPSPSPSPSPSRPRPLALALALTLSLHPHPHPRPHLHRRCRCTSSSSAFIRRAKPSVT
jgi:hypothetical protein